MLVNNLNCPFSEKDEAKRLGAKFDWQEKKWFVPVGLDLDPFSQWLPKIQTSEDDKPDKPLYGIVRF